MELSCKQCGKRTSAMCARSDCWNTEKNLAVETTRRAKEVAWRIRNRNDLAVLQFPQNFDAVSAWAERTGAQRPQDRDAIRRMAKETVYSAMTYAAIARSL
jgi:predicted DsbA family dithiol-disulfide isomerase